MVQSGDTLVLSTDEKYKDCGDRNTIYVDYKKIVDDCSNGDLIYIDDGSISLKVTGRANNSTHLITGEFYTCIHCNAFKCYLNHVGFILVSLTILTFLTSIVCLFLL